MTVWVRANGTSDCRSKQGARKANDPLAIVRCDTRDGVSQGGVWLDSSYVLCLSAGKEACKKKRENGDSTPSAAQCSSLLAWLGGRWLDRSDPINRFIRRADFTAVCVNFTFAIPIFDVVGKRIAIVVKPVERDFYVASVLLPETSFDLSLAHSVTVPAEKTCGAGDDKRYYGRKDR